MKPSRLAIRQTLVVEGRSDVARVREALDCDILVTQGFRLDAEILESIRRAQERCGVIVLTDPDGVGQRIRRRIEEAVPGVWHAYLLKEDACAHRDIGVEHASAEAIRAAVLRCIALSAPHAPSPHAPSPQAGDLYPDAVDLTSGASDLAPDAEAFSPWTASELYALGLAGAAGSAARRSAVGKAVGIGYAATNRFLFRLNHYRIPREAVERALNEL